MRAFIQFTLASLAATSVSASLVSAQPAPPPPPVDLRSIRVLPPNLDARRLVADEAVRQLLTPDAPAYLPHVFHQQLIAPPFQPRLHQFVPTTSTPAAAACPQNHIFDQGNFPNVLQKKESDRDPTGCEGSFQPAGPTTTGSNAFFQVLGTNGRTCATCHQPPNGMSVSPANLAARMQATHGQDPIFAGIDGANCPKTLPIFAGSGTAFKAAHSLLLNRGVFRVFLPVPTGAEFTVTPVRDPYGCNTTPPFDQDTVGGSTARMVSVYRRPRISANLNFILALGPLPPGAPPAKPAIMWDGRETDLSTQAVDATFGHGHAQSLSPPTTAQVAQMVAFEKGFFSAQDRDNLAQALDVAGAKGGPQDLSGAPAATGGPPANLGFDEYAAWAGSVGGPIQGRRAAISRGETLFNTRKFAISDVAGLNDIPGGTNPVQGTCSTCHSQTHAGNNLLGNIAAVDIGIGGDSAAKNGPSPSSALPILTIACQGGATTSYHGATVTTNDPGQALITGKCADIGKFMIPQLRALASRAPYFHDGTAADLSAVVKFYNKRFSAGLHPNEIADLVAFLEAL